MARYRLHRTITVAGFVADADPRTTPPSDSALFEVQRDLEGALAKGHALFFRAITSGGADVTTGVSVTMTPWLKDEGSEAFVKLGDTKSVAVNRSIQADDIGLLWFQVTAINTPGTAASIQIWVTERAHVALLSA